MTKEEIDVSTLRDIEPDDPDIAEAALDYLGIEYTDNADELDAYTAMNPIQRVRTGRSIIGKIGNIERTDSDDFAITFVVNYENFPYDNPGDVLAGFRKKESRGGSPGSFMEATPVAPEANGKDIRETMPSCSSSQKPTVTIDTIQIEDIDKGKAVLELTSLDNNRGTSSPYKHSRPSITIEEGDKPDEMSVGDWYILDEQPDDHTSDRARVVLENNEYNSMTTIIDELLTGSIDNTSTRFDKDATETFADWMAHPDTPTHSLNPDQRRFVTDVGHEVSVLQGPPGTGKTSMAVAPALLARLLAHTEAGPCRALVTGLSNKSIDEVLTDVRSLLRDYQNDPKTGDELDDVLLLRVEEPPDEGAHDGVAYTAFYGNDNEAMHIDDVRNRLKKTAGTAQDHKHIIAFATPAKTWRIADSVIEDFALKDSRMDDGHSPEPGTPGATRDEYQLFDIVTADEASMLDLPKFLLAGTFYDPGGNILISGDHRQLTPVRQHEWDEEFRPSITTLAPYLSVLNFSRVLMDGEDVNIFNDDLADIIELTEHDGVDIPLHQLQETYRCHEVVAGFLEKWVYKNLDNIDYASNVTDTIAEPVTRTDGMEEALRPDEPLTLVTYNGTDSQQSNQLEARITAEIVDAIHDDDTVGIVTPHNAQRGRITNTIRDATGINTRINPSTDDDDTTSGDTDSDDDPRGASIDVDTVERFQGGERDVIIMSATVSDPDYVAAESDFLLDLNRLNVAMSRMEKKLIVLVSGAIPEYIPLDTDSYAQALLWKGLAKDTGMADNETPPVRVESVTEFTGLAESEFTHPDIDAVDVQLYHL